MLKRSRDDNGGIEMSVDKFKRAYYLDKIRFALSVAIFIIMTLAAIAIAIMAILIWLKYKDYPVGDLPAWALPFFS